MISDHEVISFTIQDCKEVAIDMDSKQEPSLIQILLRHVESSEDKQTLLAIDILPNLNEFQFDLEMESPISACFSDGKLKFPKTLAHLLGYLQTLPASYHISKLVLRNLRDAFNGENQLVKEYLPFIDGADDDIEETNPKIFQLGALAHISLMNSNYSDITMKGDRVNILKEVKRSYHVQNMITFSTTNL